MSPPWLIPWMWCPACVQYVRCRRTCRFCNGPVVDKPPP